MSNPIISICVPTYNRINQLKKCLEYIFAARKGFEDKVEVIVSDNGSADGTYEFLKTIQEKNLKIYRNSENVGFNRNMFKLCDEYATGKYVWAIGDDDFISVNSIKMILDIKQEFDLLLLKYKLTNEVDVNIECTSDKDYSLIEGNYFEGIDAVADSGNLFSTFMSCAIFKREPIKNISKVEIMDTDWTTFSKVFPNGYLIYSAFVESHQILWTIDSFVYIVPHKKDWDDKLIKINQDILPDFFNYLKNRYKAKKYLKNTSSIIFIESLMMLKKNITKGKSEGISIKKLMYNALITVSFNSLKDVLSMIEV